MIAAPYIRGVTVYLARGAAHDIGMHRKQWVCIFQLSGIIVPTSEHGLCELSAQINELTRRSIEPR
jgi:hypothetical protein